MANTRSAAKRARQTAKRSARNKTIKGNYKTLKRKVVAAVESGDAKEAEAQFRLYSSAVDKAAKAKLIHRNAADGHKSRLAKRLTAGASK